MPFELLYGLGTLVLLAALVIGVIVYRGSRAGREQSEIERRSGRWRRDK
jgi:hypothetical protein